MKKNLKIKLDKIINNYFLNYLTYYSMQNLNQFILFFLPDNYNYIFIDNEDEVDVFIYSSHLENNYNLNKNKINMLITVENFEKWNWYPHFTNYNNYGDEKINIYLYNHIDNLIINDNYISIPLIHNYINYYKNNNIILNKINNFNQKKFCLCINRSKLNNEIQYFIEELKNINNIDYINYYDDIIKDKSCYYSIELLNIFNKYKFILCIENSYTNGYITEKIFNCFYSKSIPIYKGSPIIEKFINKDSFIDFRENNLNNSIELIKNILNSEDLYNTYINSEKISYLYNDENYKDKLYNFIENKLKNNNN